MAENKSGRGSAASTKTKKSTSKNDTPNTPEVAESKIARMKVDELRKRLKQRGVEDTGKLRKDDLVKKLIKAELADAKGRSGGSGSGGSGSGGSAKKASGGKSSDAKKSTVAKASTGKASAATKASSGKASAATKASSGSKASSVKAAASTGKASGGKQSRNDTPNTPDVDESKIARMKVDELRKRLKQRGVEDTGKLRKDDLVKKLIKAYVADSKSGAKKSGGGKNTSDGKADTGTSGSKKSVVAAGGKGAGGKSASGKSASGKTTSGGIRTGKQTSRSLKYSQEITSVTDEPERAGRSLVTTDHEVIRRWAQERDAVPATVDGTEHDDHLGVLRFDFPGGSSGGRLRQVDWDQWLDTFDKRRLNFIYQEERADGRQSNFFRLESPDREDA